MYSREEVINLMLLSINKGAELEFTGDNSKKLMKIGLKKNL